MRNNGIESFSETEIEDILYENFWIINPNYEIPDILGSTGKKGRQINIGNDYPRYIDLLFKDTLDNRPVIVEIKKDWIVRQHIGQILEYKSLIYTLSDSAKESFLKEFENNYLAPKLLLIGYDIDPQFQLMANMAGIETRIFGEEIRKLKLNPTELNNQLKSMRLVIENKLGLQSKPQFIKNFNKELNAVVKNIHENLRSPTQTIQGGYISEPIFFDQRVQFNDYYICGFYEYSIDDDLWINENHFYVDLYYNNSKFTDEAINYININYPEEKYALDELEKIKNLIGIPIKIHRNELKTDKNRKRIFKKYVKMAIELKSNIGDEKFIEDCAELIQIVKS